MISIVGSRERSQIEAAPDFIWSVTAFPRCGGSRSRSGRMRGDRRRIRNDPQKPQPTAVVPLIRRLRRLFSSFRGEDEPGQAAGTTGKRANEAKTGGESSTLKLKFCIKLRPTALVAGGRKRSQIEAAPARDRWRKKGVESLRNQYAARRPRSADPAFDARSRARDEDDRWVRVETHHGHEGELSHED